MTYCVAIKTDSGMIFASDSLTNAGIDHVSTYSKMHTFVKPGCHMFVLLAAGNLATTQSVVKRLTDDEQMGNLPNLSSVQTLSEAVDYIGHISAEVQRVQAERDTASTNFEATFIFGGQIAGQPPAALKIYPEGNHITTSAETPYLQIGESKYGKPVLDRFLDLSTGLDHAARCAVVSLDSTMRSNVAVGEPIEVLLYETDSLQLRHRVKLDEDSSYLREVRRLWDGKLREGLLNLTPLPAIALDPALDLGGDLPLP